MGKQLYQKHIGQIVGHQFVPAGEERPMYYTLATNPDTGYEALFRSPDKGGLQGIASLMVSLGMKVVFWDEDPEFSDEELKGCVDVDYVRILGVRH